MQATSLLTDGEAIRNGILAFLNGAGDISSSRSYCAKNAIEHDVFVGEMKRLNARDMIATKMISNKEWRLTPEGEAIAEAGSPEYTVYSAVPADGIPLAELKAVGDSVFKIGNGQCMKRKWLRLDKKAGMVHRVAEITEDATQQQLRGISQGASIPEAADLKKRKLVTQVTVNTFEVTKAANFSLEMKEYATELTPELIATGEWKNVQFKPYNLNAKGLEPPLGRLHPLLKMRELYRDIFIEMGFAEMPTNQWVESSFWNFDSLFQPQQHPARDAHDTFFLASPASCGDIPDDYVARVKNMHETGGDTTSIGWRYDWKLSEAKKNILRTHTTAVSARMLYALGQSKDGFKPVKYFSIDRVFRNEAVDATHLAEFHQVEGLVADYNLTLGNLMGIIRAFFEKLGLKKIKFKPAYNPYTEPSMEVFSYHEGHGKWLEVGNSGMFRPEMLVPMGLPEGVRVIAWGLSLERPAMIKYGYDNIRSLVGSKVDIGTYIKNDAICRS